MFQFIMFALLSILSRASLERLLAVRAIGRLKHRDAVALSIPSQPGTVSSLAKTTYLPTLLAAMCK